MDMDEYGEEEDLSELETQRIDQLADQIADEEEAVESGTLIDEEEEDLIDNDDDAELIDDEDTELVEDEPEMIDDEVIDEEEAEHIDEEEAEHIDEDETEMIDEEDEVERIDGDEEETELIDQDTTELIDVPIKLIDEEEEEEEEIPLVDEDEVLTLSDDDSQSLHNFPMGYESIKNLMKPLAGFTERHERAIFPLVDEQSMILFAIVQCLEKIQSTSSTNILLTYRKPISIPRNRYLHEVGGPDISLRVIGPQEPPQLLDDEEEQKEEEDVEGPQVELDEEEIKHPSPRADKKAPMVTAKPDLLPEKLLAAIAKDAFTPEKLAELQKTLDDGWKREIVMRSHCSPGKKLGDVYYFTPEGIKFRSSRQVGIYLGKRPELGLSVDNFSFAKARVSYNPDQETVRQAYVGKSPQLPRAKEVRFKNTTQKFDAQVFDSPSQRQSRGGGADSSSTDLVIDEGSEDEERPSRSPATGPSVRASSSRRSIQPPKRYATGENAYYADNKRTKFNKNQDNEEDGSMEMGMLPPKYHRGMEDSNSASVAGPSGSSGIGGSGQSGEDPYADFKRRGRPPKPGGKKDLLAQAEAMKAAKSAAGTYNSSEEEAGGAMFGISALAQSAAAHFLQQESGYFYGMSEEESKRGRNDWEGMGAEGDNDMGDERGDDGLSQDTEELLPCSIRCPGSTGQIPTLQCVLCLCLYHAKCLGFKSDKIKNFVCCNCEGNAEESSDHDRQDNGRLQQQKQQQPLKQSLMGMSNQQHQQPTRGRPVGSGGTSNMQPSSSMGSSGDQPPKKKPPPPLIRANFHQHPIPRGPPQINKLELMQQGRKMLPKMPILQPPSSFGGRTGTSGSSHSQSGGGLKNQMPKLNPPGFSGKKSILDFEKYKASNAGNAIREKIVFRTNPKNNTIPLFNKRPAMGGPPIPQLNNRMNLTITPVSGLSGGPFQQQQRKAQPSFRPHPSLAEALRDSIEVQKAQRLQQQQQFRQQLKPHDQKKQGHQHYPNFTAEGSGRQRFGNMSFHTPPRQRIPPTPNSCPSVDKHHIKRRREEQKQAVVVHVRPQKNLKTAVRPPNLNACTVTNAASGPKSVPASAPSSGFNALGEQDEKYEEDDEEGGVAGNFISNAPGVFKEKLNEKRNKFDGVPLRQQFQFKRYSQSVVTINDKKYIALPKAMEISKRKLNPVTFPSMSEHKDGYSSNDEDSAFSKCTRGKRDKVLKLVFGYLELKDLLTCSLVSDDWREVAFEKDLWETIKLRNLLVTNWDKLRNVILVRQTEILDARGLILGSNETSSYIWNSLSGLFMLRPRKLIVDSELAEFTPGLEDFKEDNPNCEVEIL